MDHGTPLFLATVRDWDLVWVYETEILRAYNGTPLRTVVLSGPTAYLKEELHPCQH